MSLYRDKEPPGFDRHGRSLPNSAPGWGLSWYLHDLGLLATWAELTPAQRVEHLTTFVRLANAGEWECPIPEPEWVHHPWRPDH